MQTFVITGAAGFIGGCLARELTRRRDLRLVLVDDFAKKAKSGNMKGLERAQQIPRDAFMAWFADHGAEVQFVFHLGARTDTAETDRRIFETLNTRYSRDLWNVCTEYAVPMLYASSAATYGNGSKGYSDDVSGIRGLKPLNAYAESKQEFDLWALAQNKTPPHWYGIKFFNVYGPGEYHKARMASVIFHAFRQIRSEGRVKLFRSYRPEYHDGEQLRDFVYIKDVLSVMLWMQEQLPPSGIYNLGTGKARTFYDLAKATAAAMEKPLQIEWIPMPEDIRGSYQYFTEAEMHKLRNAGYTIPFYSLEEGIRDYVRNYLLHDKHYGED